MKYDLSNDNPEIVARVVLFLYTSDYDPESVPSFLLLGHESTDSHTEDEPDARSPGKVEDAKTESTKATQEDESESQSDDEPPPDEIFTRLETNALVYQCADMLGIESLAVLAAERFLADTKRHFDDSRFKSPLRIMYESTSPNDEPLRLPVTRVLVKNHMKLKKLAETVSVIKEFEYNVWTLTVPLLKEAKGGVKSMVAQANALLQINCPCGREVVRLATMPKDSIGGYCSYEACTGTKG